MSDWLRNTQSKRVQQRNNQDCSIASLAMALDCNYEEVGTIKPLTAQETVYLLFQRGLAPVHLISKEAADSVHLARKGFTEAVHLISEEARKSAHLISKEVAEAVNLISREAGEAVGGDCGIEFPTSERIRQSCAGRPAILTVQGYRELHAVYWNGQEVIDPAPGREEPRKWEQYSVLEAVVIH